jgi:hypothetical protein
MNDKQKWEYLDGSLFGKLDGKTVYDLYTELHKDIYQNEIEELKFMLKVVLGSESCSKYCKHGYSTDTYPDCKLNWCDHWENFVLDKDKFNNEYRYEIAKAKMEDVFGNE